MKSISNSFNHMLETDNIKKTIVKALKHKRKTKSLYKFYSYGLSKQTSRISMLIKLGLLPKINTNKNKYKIINESTNKKQREICPPSIENHIVHHLVIQELQPIFEKGMYDFCVASVPNRGTTYGVKYIKKWLCKYTKNNKKCYILKLDIHHFFASIDRYILFEKLSKRIKDIKFLKVISRIIWHDDKDARQIRINNNNKSLTPKPNGNNSKGIPIGFYTSQWFANFYLQDFDYFVKQQLHIPHYMRYMDDMILISNNKQQLHQALNSIIIYLREKLGLELNKNWQLFRYSYRTRYGKEKGRALDFIGYVFHYNRICIRKSTLKSTRRKANKIYKNVKNNRKLNWYEASQMISYAGRIKHTNTLSYFSKYILSKVSIRQLRLVISNHSKYINKLLSEWRKCYGFTMETV